MPPRFRKLIGLAILVPGLVLYVAAAITLADFLPQFRLVKFAYFLFAGLAWTLPAIPLMQWVNKEPARRESAE